MTKSTFLEIVNYFPNRQNTVPYTESLTALCFRVLSGSMTIKLEPLVHVTLLLQDIISLLDHVIDDEADNIYQKLDIHLPPPCNIVGTIVNTATALLANLGQQLLTLTTSINCTPIIAHAISSAFYDTLFRTTVGQQASLALQTTNSLQQVWESVIAKSSPYYELCCWSGARLVTDDPIVLQKIRTFGKYLGILFQIKDDVVDMWSKDGQPNDIMTRCITLPVAYALNVLPAKQASYLSEIWQQASTCEDNEKEARAIIIESGSLFYLQTEAKHYMQQTTDLLTQIAPDSTARRQLLQLVKELSTFHIL